ncbi:MAG TPA: LON peptidase substrate-binding domain-containing protein [Chitinophagaceae bacterium]|nr:LON peptidase substrate-binding domain-containing protein [Chitinophagaceae bacterium]
MTNFIPIFPLGIVAFPGEQLNLHIFEDQYKQLINECHTKKKAFGIPSVINDRIAEMGTLVKITEIVEVYTDGRMDMRAEGVSVFRILEVVKQIPGKLYSGAIVNYPHNETYQQVNMMRQVITAIRELHRLLKVNKEFNKSDEQLSSYDLAHHAGLTIEEEYELLGLLREDQRLEYLKRHLQKILPMVAGIEAMKDKIQLNGHFKELKGFNL